jgi:hypothetical protein
MSRIPNTNNKGGKGVYVLYDGSMPVYVGKGNMRFQIGRAKRSRRRGQMWDHFSWYALDDKKMMRDIEALVLRMLPSYLRSLTKQKGKFGDAQRVKEIKENQVAEYISRKSGRKK